MGASPEDRVHAVLQEIQDRESLRSIWHRYMLLFDRGGRHDELAGMFAENAVLESRGADSGDRSWEGRDVIRRDFFERVSPERPDDDNRVYSGHHGTTHEVTLHGETARLVGRFFELTGRGPGVLLAVGGTHMIDFLKDDLGSWLVQRLVIQLDFCAQLDSVEPRTAFLGKPPETVDETVDD